uniref:pre-rRNA processing protein FTSJ3 n=1 Tax=Lepisosteus oculatus TaxID=7918 RepID=W5MRD4_LEPOC
MGKKLKVGKTRKDKFYHLAKETGYRSRSSFKLIQLNRKFQFLQKARALLDLCAAPGGWLQVASKFMPVSSLIIGVDLVPIKPIPNVVTLQEDITTEKCRQAIRKELQTWKVDVVLNDGAPNVGANWQHDAYSQAHLTLMALKLACEFLTKGGCFITKVFRSRDYQPLLWIFQQFFRRVQATKPQASRNESAEIFVVCQGYQAPDKIDNKFFDPKHAFKEVEVQAKTVKELVPVKKPKAEGYADGDLTLYHRFSVTEFVRAENSVDFLSKANEITFDSPELEFHSSTTPEIRECCRDIKVLGRKDLRALLAWRGKLRRFLARQLKEQAKQLHHEISLSSSEGESESEEKKRTKKGTEQMDEEEAEDEEMEKQLAEVKADEVAELRRKKKKLLRERRKQRERVELKMDLPGVSIADDNDSSLFSLSTIKKGKALGEISKGDMQGADAILQGREENEEDMYLSDPESDAVSLASDLDPEDLKEVEQRQKQLQQKKAPPKKVSFRDEEEEDEGKGNELLVDLESQSERRERETALWFSKDAFSELDLEADAETEIRQTEQLRDQQFKGKGGKKKGQEKQAPAEQGEDGPAQGTPEQVKDEHVEDEGNSDSDDDTSSSDDEREIAQMKSHGGAGQSGQGAAEDEDGEFEVVPVESTSKRARILDPEDLSIHIQGLSCPFFVTSHYMRHAFSEEVDEVPEWFLEDERKHRRRTVPVTREMVEEYRQRWREINARPIKKVAEAKARKKRRVLKKMEQAKKKAEAVVNTVDISEREKMAQLKSIYKKAGLGKEKREVTYVVAKRGAGRKVRRPAGVKGVFKVVDSRMKKDMRALKKKEQREGGRRQHQRRRRQ